jgi:hypothetical protein
MARSNVIKRLFKTVLNVILFPRLNLDQSKLLPQSINKATVKPVKKLKFLSIERDSKTPVIIVKTTIYGFVKKLKILIFIF